MKWPTTLTLIRHDESTYNRLKKIRESDPLYLKFRESFDNDPGSNKTMNLAMEVKEKFHLGVGDHDTPLADDAGWQAEAMAKKLKKEIALPEIIFVSPYLRTQQTLKRMMDGWPELKDVRIVEEERIREQDHGLVLLYNDWRIFNAIHPEQRLLKAAQGLYWYTFPQGENIPDVRERLRSWLTTLSRDFAGKEILAVTHHVSILAMRANLERLDEKEFLRLDLEDKPINCGVTVYKGDDKLGKDGRLVLEKYNAKLY